MARKKTVVEEEVFHEEKIIETPIEQAIHDYMMPYAESVILDRALPRVEDGLKPVQRRILYTMHELNMKPDGPYKKSARVVGDCLGKYHPHGDSSVYTAMVNMAQDFSMRNTLVNGNGNFGSIDGDSAAAMRYTEVKLEPLACELLRDLDKDTVKWVKNFDDSLMEPDVLPGRFPNILVNGCFGVAIGLATKIPPHNLTEVIDGVIAVIDNPKITIDEMLTIIQGPDFPTGGFAIPGDSFKEIYTTGRGKIIMRAKVDIESDNGRQTIVIHELPYEVNKSKLQIKIRDLQQDLTEKYKKDHELAGISEIVDESDRNGIRVAIKLKKGEDASKVLDFLYKKTDLECNFSVNMMVIADGRPQQLGLIPIIKYYIAHQRDVIYKRSQFDLNNAKKREHILDGFVIILPDIDNVVQIIKTSSGRTEAKERLRSTYGLTEKQADAILDLRLVNLTKMEVTKIEKELAELKKLIEKLTKIINSKEEQLAVVKKELLEIRNKYRTKRLTTISESREAIQCKPFDATKVSSNRGYVVCDIDGRLRLENIGSFLNAKGRQKPNNIKQIIRDSVFADSGVQTYVFTDKGNCIRLNLDNMTEAGANHNGYSLKDVCKDASDDEKCVKLFIFNEKDMEKDLYFFTKDGMVKRTPVKEYIVNKNLYQAIILKDGDSVINVEIEEKDTCIFILTDDGYCMNTSHDEFTATGRKSGGVIGIKLNDKASVKFAGQIEQDPFDKVPAGEVLFISSNGMAKRLYAYNIEKTKRATKGSCWFATNSKELLYAGLVTFEYTVALVHSDDHVENVSTEDIPISRVATGKGKPCEQALNAICAVKQFDKI